MPHGVTTGAFCKRPVRPVPYLKFCINAGSWQEQQCACFDSQAISRPLLSPKNGVCFGFFPKKICMSPVQVCTCLAVFGPRWWAPLESFLGIGSRAKVILVY